MIQYNICVQLILNNLVLVPKNNICVCWCSQLVLVPRWWWIALCFQLSPQHMGAVPEGGESSGRGGLMLVFAYWACVELSLPLEETQGWVGGNLPRVRSFPGPLQNSLCQLIVWPKTEREGVVSIHWPERFQPLFGKRGHSVLEEL
jgi:hypothetical protein